MAYSPTSDWFCWFVEGLLILIVGIFGLLGSGFSLILFSRQKVHRIFHNLLLTLTIFDLIYVVCSILLFSVSKFNETYDKVYRVYMLPYLLPLAHVGLMGSVYCTLTMTIERFLTVCYPFLPRRRKFSSRYFIIPVVVFTALYNIPKFFELHIREEVICFNDAVYDNATMVYTDAQDCRFPDNFTVKLHIVPTDMRKDALYIRVYILWMNLLIQIIIPFILLIGLNIRIYHKIKEFEQNLTQFRVGFTNRKLRDPNQKDDEPSSETTNRPLGKSFRSKITAETRISLNNDEPEAGLVQIKRLSPESGPRNATSAQKARIKGSSRRRDHQLNDTSLRKREVILAKISLYIVFVFLVCHGVRLFPNTFEMIQTYTVDYQPDDMDWPAWISRVINISHFLLAFACSANFYIYYAKHGSVGRRLFQRRKNNPINETVVYSAK